ncbi:MAG: hypothetical protein SGPRY_014921, partial [Prymnesium sp.]
MHAFLADTGFAKAAKCGGVTVMPSTKFGPCYTPGFADPLIINGGEYSTITDGYAVGVTLLVCLTNRSPIGLIDECEGEFACDWDDIPAHSLADPTVSWPNHVATTLKELALVSPGMCLCASSKRRRATLQQALQTLRFLMSSPEGAGLAAAPTSSPPAPSPPAPAPPAPPPPAPEPGDDHDVPAVAAIPSAVSDVSPLLEPVVPP